MQKHEANKNRKNIGSIFFCSIVLIFFLLPGCFTCQDDKPPVHKIIETAFFKCEKCHSLEGGIYGKGPFKSLRSSKAKTCSHDWQTVSIYEFRYLGTEWYGIDWNQELHFWNSQTSEKLNVDIESNKKDL